ncbi:MAG: gamma-glutamyl-gamma-aminobutyrate hydrolase family protein [Alphaproteobacteria bacterium]|nr:gamma-glutamyl-gamma-aminobutyrate hydrolase family protein [Alphaproteobacteria bacterium]
MSAPLIGVTACIRTIAPRGPFHSVSEKYIEAVTAGVKGIPVIVPALGDAGEAASLIPRLDGLLLTGSPSNVEPHHYDGEPSRPGTLHDPQRDATTLPLIRLAVTEGVPVLGLCRGHQELNVALGGTLHQNVHELAGKRDHRAPRDQPNEIRYAPAHKIRLAPGGLLRELAGETETIVNSLHAQAIDRPAPGLVIEAESCEDGVIEAVRLPDAPSLVLGIQWHPEWSIATSRLSAAIFARFAAAARQRAAKKR